MPEAAVVIAVDGPVASGKSSVGLGVAERLGLRYFDTGLLYRALTWLALRRGMDPADGRGLVPLIEELRVEVDAVGRVARDGQDITSELHRPDVDASVSAVSAHAAVRDGLRPAQRALVRPPGVVMAGRDIGTVVVPDAPLKIWLQASAEERARRRALQTGEPYPTVLNAIRARDRVDASRAVAPMARAADAVDVETDGRSLEDVIDHIVQLARQRGLSA